MKNLIRLAWEALFLSETPYAQMRDGPKPVPRGLLFVVLLAIILALVGLVGTTLEWASSPRMSDIRQVVLEEIQQMPWYQELQNEPEFVQQFQQYYDMGWEYFPQMSGAGIGNAALQIVVSPITTTIGWLLYGLLGHLFARLLGGRGSLAQTLGCTALAFTPRLLNLVSFLPYIAVGGVIGTWTLLSRYVALKTAHQLSWGRAMWATLLPYILAYVLVALLILILIAIGPAVATAFINTGGAQ